MPIGQVVFRNNTRSFLFCWWKKNRLLRIHILKVFVFLQFTVYSLHNLIYGDFYFFVFAWFVFHVVQWNVYWDLLGDEKNSSMCGEWNNNAWLRDIQTFFLKTEFETILFVLLALKMNDLIFAPLKICFFSEENKFFFRTIAYNRNIAAINTANNEVKLNLLFLRQ